MNATTGPSGAVGVAQPYRVILSLGVETGPLYSCVDQSLDAECPGKGHNRGQGSSLLKEG